jgi:hypothetical protein
MGGLIYYLRGTHVKPTDAELFDCGLAGEKVGAVTVCMKHIDGSSGVLFSVKGRCDNDFKISFNNEIQTWTDIPGTRLSIGYWLNNIPTPNDFLRKDYLAGHKVLLGDNNEWVIPLARRINEGCVLPKEWSMLREGEIVNNTLDKYLELQKLAEKIAVKCGVYDGETKDNEFLNSDSKLFMACVNILKVNYNLGFREISILKLFNTKNTIEIIQAVVDMPYILKVMELIEQDENKKKSLDTSNG